MIVLQGSIAIVIAEYGCGDGFGDGIGCGGGYGDGYGNGSGYGNGNIDGNAYDEVNGLEIL